MARQFNGRLTREALRERLAGQPVGAAANAPHPVAVKVMADSDTPTPGTDLEQVVDWLTRLHLLNGVPFNYLVPDERMLPAESIRFFQVDDNWIQALLDGAYSIGFAGVASTTSDGARGAFRAAAARRARAGVHRRALLARATVRGTPAIAAAHAARRPGAPAAAATEAALDDGGSAPEVLTGFLLRSAVVSGWPGLEVHGFSDGEGTQPLPMVRMEIIAPSLLLVLFAGVVQRVDLQEPGEAVHFGVDPNGAAWQKQLRYANGTGTVTVGSYISGGIVPVPLRGTGTPAVLSLDTLAGSMSGQVWTTPPPADTTFTAAQFALEMVEGVQAVSFQIPSS